MYERALNRIGIALATGLALCAVSTPTLRASDPLPAPRPAGGPARVAAGSRPGIGVRTTSIVGVAWQADNTPIPNAKVRLRNVVTGRIAAAAMANEAGQFTFSGVEPGSYLIELVTDAGKIQTVGHTFTVAPGETVATFVRLSAKAPWFNGFFSNAASAVAATAASAGVTALAPEAKPCSSPSPGCN
jgi:hypothetical protein